MSAIRYFYSVSLAWAVAFSTVLFAQTAPAQTDIRVSPTFAARGLPPGVLAPLTGKPVSAHAPFEAGDCKLCHTNSDPKQPGPLIKPVTTLCLGCHEEFQGVLKRAHPHPPAQTACTNCHNPHNANYPKMLLQETGQLCTGCHKKIAEVMTSASVPHKALSSGTKCLNCHNPHAGEIERLLVLLPFDLCLSCHNVDTMMGANGKKLQNMKAWLENNPDWHGPIKHKDCVACHQPHGGNQFRLLDGNYPKEFYAPYDPATYDLCFTCHKEKAFSTAQTTTLTRFRDGEKNLHFVHLQQPGRGRTCRACHEVHASKQKRHIRDGVPYGSGGWVLKLNYQQTATGGSCQKTCHQERGYANRKAP